MLFCLYTGLVLIFFIPGSSERDRTGLAGTADYTARSAEDLGCASCLSQ